jgi:cyclopropane fatty-acyl-phospholipid synthase-like methyltransferase
MQDLFYSDRFRRSSQYHPDWIKSSVSGGANPLWLAEWLTNKMNLKRGMRVLDLGCGRAMSSIFLHREFGVEVWAVDLWVSASENLERIRDAGVGQHVFPLNADARHLPFAEKFFDAIISIDSFFYYGTDDLYLPAIMRFLKPGGYIAIAGAGTVVELNGVLPMHLQKWWTPDLWCLHSAGWWKQHWDRTGFVDILLADTMEEGWQHWLKWHLSIAPDNKAEIDAVEEDAGRYIGYVRVIACRKKDVIIDDPVTSVPYQYTKTPLLRSR